MEDEPGAGEVPEESLPGPVGGVGPIPSLGGQLLHQADCLPCVLGYQPALAQGTPTQTEAPAVDEWFWRVEEVWSDAHVRLQGAVHRQKEQADRHRSEPPVFDPGDRVWLSNRNFPLRLPCKKQRPQFVRPCKVLWRVNEVTYRLQLPTNYRLSPFMFLSSGRWFLVPWMRQSPTTPLRLLWTSKEVTPVLSDPFWTRRGVQLQYLVDWEGY
ncbi:uncharacterized protein LOC129861799 [Salvelinus fontinalis]|uniref:uncharacterized protein LOC129861799 n=1 Tax=Salvelinus fontinalis TaxID=8038 RepID=UPI002486CBB1|nr:uncharacterized protein LOC129861799 [Salvelinus fontinalis]